MPQGTVIAIKPMGLVEDSQQFRSFSAESNQGYPSDAAANPKPKQVLYFIKVKPKTSSESIVWFLDAKNKYKKGDLVQFDIDESRTRQIKGAVNVIKDKSPLPALPKGILPQLALVAAALLIIGVTVDKNR